MTQPTQSILDKYPEFEATIGIEVHVQLKTNTKIFCGCPNSFGDKPNTNICQICCGYPGTLPVLNSKVVDYAIMTGLATNCSINQSSYFARKHYFYPDLPKNYQITQDKTPICFGGHVTIPTGENQTKTINLMRIHIEEDAGKNIHSPAGYSLVDLNRAGTPLLEIVTHPDISSADEARSYLMQLHALVRYLGVSDANMEQGSFRADVNISIKKKTDTQLGTRAELKNINSFKFIHQAIEYEIERQIGIVQAGEKVAQETRLWDSKQHKTYGMRGKGDAADYRYFVDPDLPELIIDDEWIDEIEKKLPELPQQKLVRFQSEYKLTAYEAGVLTSDKDLADYFENTAQICKQPKLASNWILRDVLGYLKEQKLAITESPISPQHLAELIGELDKGTINSKAAQTVFAEMIASGKAPAVIIEEKDLKQIGSEAELEKIILEIIENNPDNVEKYRSGNDRVFTFFVGQCMKATRGKGNPKIITQLLKKHLA